MNNILLPRLLIVDDHAVVRKGVRAYLENFPQIGEIAEADTIENTLKSIRQSPPQVVLMDLILRNEDGITATKAIRAEFPEIQVIILTSLQDKEKIISAFEAGALSYLSKSTSPEGLLEAILLAAKGESVISPEVAQLALQTLIKPQDNESVARLDSLSEREVEVFRAIADGLSNADIGKKLFISEKTVKSHVSSILAKLQVNDRTQAAIFAWKHKLVS